MAVHAANGGIIILSGRWRDCSQIIGCVRLCGGRSWRLMGFCRHHSSISHRLVHQITALSVQPRKKDKDMAGATRRQIVLGSVALALSPARFTRAGSAAHVEDRELVSLGLQLERRKRRVRNLHRRLQLQGTTHAWQEWSDACSELAQLCERIALVPAVTVQGIAIRYEALAVGLLDEDVIMDEAVRRQAATLRRALAHMVCK